MKHIELELGKNIWKDFINGSEQAFGVLYDLYNKDMYRYGFLYSKKVEVIEDAIHDVFLQIFKNRRKLPSLENPKVYLFIALRNTLLNTYKTKEIAIDTLQMSNFNHLVDSDAEQLLIGDEEKRLRIAQLQSLIKKLTEKDKQVIYYRFVEDISYANIAELMGINEQSAKNRVHRALNKMRMALDGAVAFLFVFLLSLLM